MVFVLSQSITRIIPLKCKSKEKNTVSHMYQLSPTRTCSEETATGEVLSGCVVS